MAARAIWKGLIQMGAATVPVKLYSAVEDRSIRFNLLDRNTLERVTQKMIDPETGEEAPKEEIRRAVEVEPHTFVVLTDEELAKAEPEPARDIEVLSFLPPGRIVHQWYDRPYYLGPDGNTEGYFALAEAMEKTEREGLVRWAMRKKQYVGALRARDGYLLVIRLRNAEEVLSAKDLPAPGGRAPDKREIAMAEQLISILEDEFRAEDFRDEYRERVEQFLDEKAKGLKPRLAPPPKAKKEEDLSSALEASLKAARKPAAQKPKEKTVA